MEGRAMNEIINPVEVVRQEVLPIPEQAKMIVVKNQLTLVKANDFFLTIKALRKKIADTFNPIIQKAHEAHKEALNQKALIEAPLVTAETYLNRQVTDYTREQERKRREEEEILRQEAIKAEMERRKKEEDDRLAKAADIGKAPLAYVDANMPTLNTLARRLMKEMSIPGVKAVSTSSVAATGGRKAQ